LLNFKEEKKPFKDRYDDRIKVLAEGLGIGVPTLSDIIEELKNWQRSKR